jgi:hypothetical protein
VKLDEIAADRSIGDGALLQYEAVAEVKDGGVRAFGWSY